MTVVTQDEIYQGLRRRTSYLISTYWQDTPPTDDQAAILGTALSWLSRAANDVPQFRVWLEREIECADTDPPGPFDIDAEIRG